uniref:Uncharacterized protein n=1 Tax=Onchocerca volvulus TaxID=6282 RepID=A0A8R1Y010_ONCVO
MAAIVQLIPHMAVVLHLMNNEKAATAGARRKDLRSGGGITEREVWRAPWSDIPPKPCQPTSLPLLAGHLLYDQCCYQKSPIVCFYPNDDVIGSPVCLRVTLENCPQGGRADGRTDNIAHCRGREFLSLLFVQFIIHSCRSASTTSFRMQCRFAIMQVDGDNEDNNSEQLHLRSQERESLQVKRDEQEDSQIAQIEEASNETVDTYIITSC